MQIILVKKSCSIVKNIKSFLRVFLSPLWRSRCFVDMLSTTTEKRAYMLCIALSVARWCIIYNVTKKAANLKDLPLIMGVRWA
jgi:hypothetical protein